MYNFITSKLSYFFSTKLFPNGIFDPVAEFKGYAQDELNPKVSKSQMSNVHIRVRKRNARAYITTVEGIPPEINFKKLLRELKRSFSCNGTIITTDGGKVIQLQGDQRKVISGFLVDEEICEERNIVIHGF